MKVKLSVAVGAVAVAIATIAYAQTDAIAERQALMKQNGAAIGTLVQMAKGDAPFDAAVAKTALETIASDMATFPTLFPEGSDTGSTKAAPTIWTDMAGFQAASEKLRTDALAAAGSVTTLEGVQAAVGAVGADCGACHQKYRL
jgi:cytochrome c556